MNSTEPNRSTVLALALFDDLITPLAEARRAAGASSYFPVAGEADVATYFVSPDLARMRPSDFEILGGDSADGLIDALADYWAGTGDAELVGMAPRLKEIAQALHKEAAEQDGNVDVLCYTLF